MKQLENIQKCYL